ncbi:MAG TPA: metallophosphoesterase [Alphaproteobacteria bacterium]
MPVYLEFERNEKGRDFVVGDLHGCYSLLDEALVQVGFGQDVDRLFCTGDLVDRGPESHRAVSFLRQHWFHAVMGNHDKDVRDFIRGESKQHQESWVRKGDRLMLDEFAWFVERMPRAIGVQTKQGLRGIVHVQVPRGLSWQTFIQRMEEGEFHALHTPVYSAFEAEDRRITHVEGIAHVFAGHSGEIHGIRHKANTIFIDTNAKGRLMMEVTGGPKKVIDPLKLTLVDMSTKYSAIVSKKKHDRRIDIRLAS